ncbi:related to protoporphyrinogen oxidase [Fusarium proliferatum]|nr:related to protoporphyrinogen oxidase [Fusarium proliferatum]
MTIYVITGISRGLGYELARQLSNDHSNTVVGIVRDKSATITKISQDAELNRRSNIHVIEADLTNYNALKDAVNETAKITGGSIDYLIANAAYVSKFDTFDPMGALGNTPKELEDDLKMLFDVNVVANIHLFNLFIPLILRGKEKKVVTISTGLADLEFTNNFEHEFTPLYSISKAAMNMAVAKFNAQYKKKGVLFMSVCPGMVDVGQFNHATPQQMEAMGGMMAKFKEYAPHFTGPATAEAAVKDMRAVWENATIEGGYGGAYLSQFGNKQWL